MWNIRNLEKILAIIFLGINLTLSFLNPFTNQLLILAWSMIILIIAIKAMPKRRIEKALTSKQKRLMKEIQKNIPSMDNNSFIKIVYEKEHPEACSKLSKNKRRRKKK